MPPPIARVPLPVKPIRATQEMSEDGWWIEPGGWIYHPNIGWMHLFRPMRDMKIASWYGPPPPMPPPAMTSREWDKIFNPESKTLS